MRLKRIFIATLILGTMAFPFGRNVTPVVTHAALPATSTAAGAAAQGFGYPPTNYDVRIMSRDRFGLVAWGTTESGVYTYYQTPYCDEAWRFVRTNLGGELAGTYQIMNRNSGLCLVVRGTADGNRAVQSMCNKQYRDQLWWVYGGVSDGIAGYRFVNANSEKALLGGGYMVQAYQRGGTDPLHYNWLSTMWWPNIDNAGKCHPPN
jgi:Ricin-type beta-trefoil lectin domain-like